MRVLVRLRYKATTESVDRMPVTGPLVESGLKRPSRLRAGWWSVPGAVRISSHLAVWASVLVPMFAELARGWRPLGDDAAIASRAYQVFSLHPPLTGLASAASVGTGHVVFDPGPLMFYLLAVPVHLDPAHGLFWGAALCCGAVLSLSIEAAWSLGAWMIGAVVGFCVLDLVWLTPAVFENLPWNAYFPLPFLIAALVLAWVVVMGRTRWWPVLVVSASVAAQSHLIFVVPAAALVVLGGVFGVMTRRPRRYGWLVVGLGVGLLCWLAPLIQELGAHPNLTALIKSGRGQATLGLGFGLRMVELAGAPHPIWLTHLPVFYPFVGLAYTHASWYGVLVLALLVVITAVALWTGRQALGALGAVSVAVSAGMVVSFAVFPVKNLISLAYLVDALWVVGIFVWAVVAWATFAAAHVVLAREHRTGIVGPANRRTVALGRWAGALALGALGVVGILGIRPAWTRPGEISWNPQDVALVARAATTIERATPEASHFSIRVSLANRVGSPSLGNLFMIVGTTEGVAFRLEADGWLPGVPGSSATYTGLTIPPNSRWPSFLITVRGTELASVARVR